MNTTNNTNSFIQRAYSFLVLFFLISFIALGQENNTEQDTTKTGYSMGPVKFPDPNNITSKYTYDPVLDRYIYTEKIGGFNIKYPLILTPQEFQRLVLQENMRDYYKQKIDAAAGQKQGSEEEQKNLLPDFYVNSGFFETIFGSDVISIIPQGSVEIDLGILYSRQDNPAFSPRNRSNFTFDFDQRISVSLLGKVGTRLQITANYDTESTFDFQNLVKLEYTPTEDDIVKKIEVGNVNMPLNSTLITGAQSLFGVKTQLQFGKTTVTAVFSEQQSQSRQVTAQGGGTLEEFEFFARDYDENRHFFLSHFFRENYDSALLQYPYVQNRGIQITRVEVWVTNRNNQTQNVRNVVALQDLGESDNIGLPNPPPNFTNVPPGSFPDNGNNDFNPQAIGQAGNLLTEQVRDITNVEAGIQVPVNEGFDYGKIETARKLVEGSDYVLSSELGYISLNQRLLNDEVLAVAFQYTVNGQVYQVGEFANDGVDANAVEEGSNGSPQVTNNSLVLKMLKSAVTVVDLPIWDLMMKNIYDTGAFQLEQEDFRLNIFYTEASPVNYITPVQGSTFPPFDNNTPNDPSDDTVINETPLIRLFHLDRLNFNNDPQSGGDGFFDFVNGITVLIQNGKIIFTKVEPFGEYLFDVLDDPDNPGDYEDPTYANPNQEKYVYDLMYKSTKIEALNEAQKNKFQIKGRFKSSGGDGIPIGAFNVPRGSVRVTAGGRLLVEGIDYTVNYQLGRVQILDEALKASNTPINVSVENNAIFGQQTRRFTGLNVEHQFNQDFLLGATFLNLNERPITQKANFNSEPINNSIFGLYGNYATEVPFFTRLVNKLPNVDTDVPSNLSIRGEFAYLSPGAPKGTDFNQEPTAYIDDFEGTQGAIDLTSPLPWFLSSRPDFEESGITNIPGSYQPGIENGYGRSLLNWYTIDPIFYSAQRPAGITDEDISDPDTRRVFINEIFPQVDIVQGNTSVIFTLDLAYYPTERGPYNFDPAAANGNPLNPNNSWGGITRQITSTDFEQANVEFIEFWVQDPFLDNPSSQGGKLFLNLGNISEDVLKDGKKVYENGLPEDGDISLFNPTAFGSVVPQNQSLIYTFGTTGQERANQDVGYDGYSDDDERVYFPAEFANEEDPAKDNYTYFLNTEGSIQERYKPYNGLEGNTPDTFSDTNRGSTTQPDVEDINRDNTMNTIDSYFEYEVDIRPSNLNINNPQINDIKTNSVTLPNGTTRDITWYQFRLPISQADRAIGGIADTRSIRFIRMFMTDFEEETVLRFATLDLVRSDWRRYTLDLDNDPGNNSPNSEFSVGIIGIQENDGNYVSPPGIRREQLNNNNTIVRQNEQSLVLKACELVPTDSKGVFKNISLDMRQYKRLRMFMHAQAQKNEILEDGQVVGFIRMGNDFTDNFYQIEVPLVPTGSALIDPSLPIEQRVWPIQNEINLPLEVLQQIKSVGIFEQTLTNPDPTFYDVIDGALVETPVPEFSPYTIGQQRVAIKGNPNFGDIRVLMVGLKNTRTGAGNACAEIWYNELRMSDLDNEGGWAAIMSMDTNFADFANVSATGRHSTQGFGGLEQTPNERSREDVTQYDVVSNVNLGQLLPKKWGVQIPFNYGQSEEIITPQFDEFYRDIELDTQLENPGADRDSILNVNQNYTKRKSINFIGVRKNRTGEEKPQFYDVENFTFNYSYNKLEHRDFEIENSLDQNIRTGVNYNFSFEPKRIEPFAKNDSILKSRYWKLIKDFNFNPLPSSFSVNADIRRQFSKQKFREVELGGDNIGIEELFRRNYTFDFQYVINYNLTDALSFNFTAANSNIVRNYFINDNLNGRQNPELDVWDGFFDLGDPNLQTQQLQLNYEIPINKIPYLDFISANYAYTGTFQWQKGSDLNENFVVTDINGSVTGVFDLGHTIQNSNVHALNTTLNFDALYRSIGLVKKSSRRRDPVRRQPGAAQTQGQNEPNKTSTGEKAVNTIIDLVTMVKRAQLTYQENNGTFLPGYLLTPGFIGTMRPSLGYTFGFQDDVRNVAARNGWLTAYQEFNQQYTEITNKTLDYSANLEPLQDLKIDLIGNRIYSESASENFRVDVIDGEGNYVPLTPNTFGNFSISSAIISTSFSKSDEFESAAFDDFRDNRLIVARRLASEFYGNDNYPVDDEGFPIGFGKNNQRVLIPSFLAAYKGSNPESVSTSVFRDVPIPNWTLKYTGLMRIPWFKRNFRRFSIQHGYRSSYTINQFRTNLDYVAADPDLEISAQPDAVDQAGNFKNEILYSNINLEERFSPLVRLEFEMQNSVKVLAEIQRDRLLSLSLDNNLLTEIQGREYTLGLGYRIKDLRIRSSLAGSKQVIKSDLNMRADISVRDNKTIIRYLDLLQSQITAGQTIWSVKYTADYAFSKNLTGIFYLDYTFSDFAISTSFPQSSLRTGITLRYNFGN